MVYPCQREQLFKKVIYKGKDHGAGDFMFNKDPYNLKNSNSIFSNIRTNL